MNDQHNDVDVGGEEKEEIITPQKINRPWKYIPHFSDDGCRLTRVEKEEDMEKESEEGLLQYYRHNRLQAERPGGDNSEEEEEEEDVEGELEVIQLANVLYGKPSRPPEEEVHEELIVPVKINRKLNSQNGWPDQTESQFFSSCEKPETVEETQSKSLSAPFNDQQPDIPFVERESLETSLSAERENACSEGFDSSEKVSYFPSENAENGEETTKIFRGVEKDSDPTAGYQDSAEVNEEIIEPQRHARLSTRPELLGELEERPVSERLVLDDPERSTDLPGEKKDEDQSVEVDEELILEEKVTSQQRPVPVFVGCDVIGGHHASYLISPTEQSVEHRTETVREELRTPPATEVFQEPKPKENPLLDADVATGRDENEPTIRPGSSAETKAIAHQSHQKDALPPTADSSSAPVKPPRSRRTHSDNLFGFLRRRSKSKETETKEPAAQEGSRLTIEGPDVNVKPSEGAKGKSGKTVPTGSKKEQSSPKPSLFQKLGFGKSSKKSEKQEKQTRQMEGEVRPKAATLPREESRTEGKTNIRIFEILAKSQEDVPPETKEKSKSSESARNSSENAEAKRKDEPEVAASQKSDLPSPVSLDVERSRLVIEGPNINTKASESKNQPEREQDAQHHATVSEKPVAAAAAGMPADQYSAAIGNQKPQSAVKEGIDAQQQINNSQFIVAVAIDFGTAFSGYAFSFIHGPDSVHMMGKWEDGDPGVINQKTPTTLLLTPDGQFHSFGFSARNNYHDLSNEDAKEWLYFDRFKMSLYETQECGPSTTITAANGKRFSALEAVTMTIRFFRDHALREISSQSGTTILNDDVLWIITVPAIWTAPAKQFMRMAAYQAGLASPDLPNQLIVALEPEAASVHICRLQLRQLIPEKPVVRPLTIEGEQLQPSDVELFSSQFSRVVRYMTVDCGGGTVDITVHELNMIDSHIQELHVATGGPHGSFAIDVEFERLLGAIFGRDFVESFRHERPSGWIGLMMAFESRKRAADPRRTNQLNIALPFAFIDYYKKTKGTTVEEAIKAYGDSRVRWSSQGMLRLTQEAMKQIFQPTIDKIKEAIVNVLSAVKGIEYIFLVGGLTESGLVQCEIRDQFKDQVKKVVIPQEASLAVIKGAVAFGLNPSVITERRSKMTYGAAVLNRFVAGKHLESKRVNKDGVEWCKDIFDTFVKAGQVVRAGDKVVRQYLPASVSQKQIVVTIYCTESSDPTYITDPGVWKCANVSLDLEESRGQGSSSLQSTTRRRIETQLLFSETEIKVTASDVATGNQVNASIDFLNI